MRRYTYSRLRRLDVPPYVRPNDVHRSLDTSLIDPQVGLLLAKEHRYGVTRTLTKFHDDISQIEINKSAILVAVLDLAAIHSLSLAVVLMRARNAIVTAIDTERRSLAISEALGLIDCCWEIYKRAMDGDGYHPVEPVRTARCRTALKGLRLTGLAALAMLPHEIGELANQAGLTSIEVLSALVGVHLASSPVEHLLDHLVEIYHNAILPRISPRLRNAINLEAPNPHDLEIIMADLLLDLIESVAISSHGLRLLLTIDAADTLIGESEEPTFMRNRLAKIVGAADVAGKGFNALLAGQEIMEESWRPELILTNTQKIELSKINRVQVESAWQYVAAPAIVSAVCNLAFAGGGDVPAGALEDAWDAARAP